MTADCCLSGTPFPANQIDATLIPSYPASADRAALSFVGDFVPLLTLGLPDPDDLANVLATNGVSTECRLQMEAEIDAKLASFFTPLGRLIHVRRQCFHIPFSCSRY